MSDGPEASQFFAAARASATQGSFEDALNSLESVVAHLEQGRLSLADALSWYEVGLILAQRCEALLDEAELTVTTLESSVDERRATGVHKTETISHEQNGTL